MNLIERVKELLNDDSVKRVNLLKGGRIHSLTYKKYENGDIIDKREIYNSKDLSFVDKPIEKID